MKIREHEDIQNPKTDTPAPDEMLPATDVKKIVKSCAAYLSLSEAQKSVLIVICDDFLSGNTHSDSEIAEIAGVHRNTVYNCKHNSTFAQAIVEIMPELVKVKLPKYLSMIEKHGERDFQPLKFLLEYAGLFIPRSQRAILHARMDTTRSNVSAQEQIDAILSKLGQLGFSPERVCERMRKLQREGAF